MTTDKRTETMTQRAMTQNRPVQTVKMLAQVAALLLCLGNAHAVLDGPRAEFQERGVDRLEAVDQAGVPGADAVETNLGGDDQRHNPALNAHHIVIGRLLGTLELDMHRVGQLADKTAQGVHQRVEVSGDLARQAAALGNLHVDPDRAERGDDAAEETKYDLQILHLILLCLVGLAVLLIGASLMFMRMTLDDILRVVTCNAQYLHALRLDQAFDPLRHAPLDSYRRAAQAAERARRDAQENTPADGGCNRDTNPENKEEGR